MSTATIKPDRLPTSSANEDEWGKEEPPHEDKGLPLAAVTPSTASDDDGTVAFESRLKRCLQMQKGHPLGYPLSGVLGGIRTHGLSLRRRTLYPAELRRRILFLYSTPSAVKCQEHAEVFLCERLCRFPIAGASVFPHACRITRHSSFSRSMPNAALAGLVDGSLTALIPTLG